jgi:hypothetical protein
LRSRSGRAVVPSTTDTLRTTPAGRVEKGIGRTPPHPATVAVRVPSGTGMVPSSWALCPGHVSRIRQGASEVQADQLRDEEVSLVNYPSTPITGPTP